jgi:hypothetical protein
MGEAKDKKRRLGEWYDKPIVSGHPDYVPAKPRGRREYDRSVLVVSEPGFDRRPETDERVVTIGGPKTSTAPAVPEEKPGSEPHEVRVVVGRTPPRPAPRRVGMLGVVALLSTICAGVDIGPPPEPKRKR